MTATLPIQTLVTDRPASRKPLPTPSPPPTIKRTIRDDKICILTFDRPGSAANIFDAATLSELREELDLIAATPDLKGLVLTSAKRSIFIAGADLRMMDASPVQVRELIELGQSVMNRLAAMRIPTVAAIHGAAVGGGYELCLACDYRVASNDRATKIGLPETQLGLLPAWGGSTRLPRLIGLPAALAIILAGKTLAAKPAVKRGLVDELVPAEYLLPTAVRMIKRGKRTNRSQHWLVNNPLSAAIIRSRARTQVLKKTGGHYPAPLAALDVVTHGISKSVEESLRLERERVLELIQGDTCRNLIRVFFLQERAKKLTLDSVLRTQDSAPSTLNSQPSTIHRAAVIGSGIMGAGIAQWLSARQLPVILRDINVEQVAKGMASISKIYHDAVKRHVFTPGEARAGMDRISPAPVEVPLRNIDLVIEAAVEKLDLKTKIFQRLDELVTADAILATNTSALPVSELAAATRHPERVLGLHFFNPVHRMQLVEIVAARQTSPEVLQRAVRFVQQIGKLPVIVQDSPGFLVNRILMPYLVEAGNLFANGASVHDLDKAMLDFGMPMGPMRLLDEVGIDVAMHVAGTLATSFQDRMSVPAVLAKMAQGGLLGRKSGRGFYLYPTGKDPIPNPELTQYVLVAPRSNGGARNEYVPSSDTRHLTLDALSSRMVLLMINEAARCLEERIVTAPEDVDFAMVMGTGFAPFRGGPLRYADSIGSANLVQQMDALVKTGTTHFAPCALLRDLANRGSKFYQEL
jgi:3-hydroxyacyl-CoA dehydrogenase/enoyl-CoA hydratase/3-hydroxybutyryl-CoA epimerase